VFFIRHRFSLTDLFLAISILMAFVTVLVVTNESEEYRPPPDMATERVLHLIDTHPDTELRQVIQHWLEAGSVSIEREAPSTSGEHTVDTALSISLNRNDRVRQPVLMIHDHFMRSDFALDDEQGWGAITHEYHHLRQILLLGWWADELLTGEITASFAETRLECEYTAYLQQCYFLWSRGQEAQHPYCDVLGVEGPKGLRSQIVRDMLRLPGYQLHASYLGYIAVRGPGERFASENIADKVFSALPDKYSYMEIITTP